MPAAPLRETIGRSHWTAAAALFLLLSVIHTWPLATAPATLSRNDNGDAQLNEWIIAWVAHQLPRNPGQLFQGNIFYPARDTLAFSEPLIAPALLAAPALWLGASPVLAYNLLLVAGFTLTGLATYAVVHSWTNDRMAGFVAGSLFAFNTHTLTRLAHVQGIHAYGLPLALWCADALIARPAAGPVLGLAACMAMMAYTSGYLFVFAVVMIAVLLIARAAAWLPRTIPVLTSFALAAMITAVAVLPVYLPYRRVAIEQGMVRSLEIIRDYSATPAGYLAAAGTIHISTWSGRLFANANPVDAFFPGIVATLLAAMAIWSALRRGVQRPRVLMLVLLGAAGFVLSIGLRTPIYGWLFAVFPPMQGLRAAARFGNLFLLAIAILAGLGLAAWRDRTKHARWRRAVPIAALVLVNVEALRAPFQYRRFDGVAAIYGILAREPGPVVLAETPFYPPHAVFENAEYVLNSTAHWRPLMNGYSGYTPESYRRIAWTFWYFPEERAIKAMREAGVTHITVHPHRFGNEAAATIEKLSHRPDFELVAIGARPAIRLYRLR
jgi:hypothetical protein